MAQQPRKLVWKEKKPYGLSASQFGDALGFGGLIWDYVDYRRKCIGTEMEFTGNAATTHGIRTEDKSRSLYELLTGTQVHDGSFFLSDNELLGCSPDGRIFLDKVEGDGGTAADDMVAAEGGRPSHRLSSSISGFFSSSTEDVQSPVVGPSSSSFSPHAPGIAGELKEPSCGGAPRLSVKRRRACSPAHTPRVRLLEIKSPVNSLYNGSYEKCKPFGIPLSYMCQMQGQMAISKANECDFFVFLNHPACECVCWRVKRSEAFWKWAEPKLLQTVYWIRNGQPEWLERGFKYKPFDFSQIEVLPIVFPFNLTAKEALTSPLKFPFFERFPSPFADTTKPRETLPKGNFAPGDAMKTLAIEEDLVPSADSPAGQKRIAAVVQMDIVRYLFDINSDYLFGLPNEGEDVVRAENSETTFFIECACRADVVYQVFAKDAFNQLNSCGLLEDLQLLAVASPYACVRLILRIPFDWFRGQVRVYLSLADDGTGAHTGKVRPDYTGEERTCVFAKVRFYEQSFFRHLTVIRGFYVTQDDEACEAVLKNPFLSSRRLWQEDEMEELVEAGGSATLTAPAPCPAALCSQPIISTPMTPSEERVSLSQQIRLSLSQATPTRLPSSTRVCDGAPLSTRAGDEKDDGAGDVLYVAVTPEDLSDTLVQSKEWTHVYYCEDLWESTRLYCLPDTAGREARTLFMGPREALATFLDIAVLNEEECLTENVLLLHVRRRLAGHTQTVRMEDDEVTVLDKMVTFCFLGERVSTSPVKSASICPLEVLEKLAIVPRISLFLGRASPADAGGSLTWLEVLLNEHFVEHPISLEVERV